MVNVSKGAAVKYVGGKLVGTSGNAATAARQAAQYGQSAEGVLGYANPDYYIKDVRDSQGNLVSTGGTLTVDSRGDVIDSAGGNYGNVEATSTWNNYYADNPTQAIQEVESQRAQEAQFSSLEQRKAEQAQYAAERAAQEYSGATADMYGDMAREAATGGTTRPNVEPQSTFTRQTTKDGKRFADSPTSDNYQNVYREESIFGSQTTEVSQGTTDLQKMERMLIDAKINNTERELDSLNQQIALSDQKLKNITSIEKAKNAQKGSSGVAGGITEPYLESSNPEYAAENERMKNLKAQQQQMKKVFDAQTEEKRQKGSLTAAFDRNVQGISRDPAPMDSDPVVADYGMREQGSTPFLTSIYDNEALKADNPDSPFAGLTDATPGALEKSQRDDVDGITAWGGWTPHKGDDRLPWGQVRAAFSAGTDSAPSLTIPGTEGAKRDELNKIFYENIDTRQDGLFAASDGKPKYVNIGQGGQAIETYTDDLGRDATRVVRTFDPVGGEERDTLQAIYARQFEDRMMNREQREYFNALTGGQVSISDALTKPRTAQSYTYDGVSGQSDRPDGNLGIWLAEQNLKGDEKMSSITWREPRSTGAPGTESNRSEQKRPVSVPEGTTYTPSFDENYRRMMTPVELVGPPAPQKLTPEATQALGEYIGDVKEFHGSDVTEYQIMYTNPQGAVSIINVAPNDLERNYANLIGLGVQPDSMQLTPQYGDRIAPLSPNIAIASSIFAPRFGDSQAEGKLPPRKSLIGGIDLSTEEGRLQYMQEGEWYEKAFKGVAAEVTNVLYVADNIRKRGVNVDQWSEGWETTVFDTILNPYTKPFESTEFKEFFDTEKALYEQSQATTTQATQAVGIGGTAKQSTDSSPDWMIYLKYMGTDTYSKQYTKEQKKETEFFMDNAWYMVPNTIAFVGTFGINVGLGTVKAIGTTLAKVGLKTASATSSFTPYVTPIKGGFQINAKALEATATGTITQKVGIFLQEKAFPVESGIARSLYKKMPSITQFDQPVPKIDKAADLVQLPRQMESLTGSTRGSTDQLYDASGKALGDVEVTFPKGQRTEEFIPKTDVNPTRADDSVGMTSDEIIYLRMDDVGNLPPSRPQPLPSEPPVAREAMPLGWAEGKMSQAPPVAWKQDVITTEVMKVGRFDDIQVFPQTTSVVGKKYTIPKNIPIIGGKEVTVGGQAIRNPGVYTVQMTEAATSRTVETTATIYQKTFPKTGKWGGMFQTKYDPEQTGLGILDPLTGKISDTKLAELPGAIRIPRYGRQGVYTDYYLDMTPIIEQSGLMGTIRGEQLLLSQMTIRTSVAQAAGLTPVSLARGAPKINEQLIGGRLEETVSADMWSALPVTKKTVGKTIPQEQLAIKADQLLQRVIGYSDITGGAGKVDVPTSGLRAGYLDEKGVYRVDKEAVKKNYPEIYEATNMGDDSKYMQGFRDWKAMPKKDLQSTSVSGKGGDQLEYLRSVQQRVDPILSTSVFSSGSRSYPLASSILKARESWDITNMKIQKLRDDYQSARRDITITEQQTAEYSQAMDVLTTEAIKGKSRIQVLNKELGVVNMQTLRRDQNLQFGQIKNVSGSQMFRVLDDSGLSEKVRLNSGNLANVESKIRALDSDILKTKKTLEDSTEKLKLYETMKDSRTIDQYADVNAQQVTTAYTKGLEDELSKLLAARKQMEVDLSRVRGGSGSTNWMLDTADKAEAGKFESSGELIKMGWREVPVNTGYRQVTPIEMRFLKKSYNEYMSNISAGESLPFSEWLGVGRYDEIQSIRSDSITDLKALGGKSDDFDVTLRELQAEQANQPNYVYGYLDDSGKFIQSDGSKGSLFEVGEKGYASIQSRLLKEDIRSINLRIKGYQSAIVKVKTGGSPFFTDKPVTGTTPAMIGGSDPLASVRATQVAHSIPESLEDDISRFLVADKKMEKLQIQKKAYETALLPLYNQKKKLNNQKNQFYATLKKTLFSTYVRPTAQGDVMNLLKEWVKAQRKVATTGSPDDRYWAKILNLTSSAIVGGKKVKVDNFRSEVIKIADLTKDIGKTKKGKYTRMDATDLGLTQNQIDLGIRYNDMMNDVYFKWSKNITDDEAADLLRAEVTESSITGNVKVQKDASGGSIGWTEGYTDEAIPSVQGFGIRGLDPSDARSQKGAESKYVKAINVLVDVDRIDEKFANLSKQMRPYEQKLGAVNETINDQTDVMKRITLDTGVTRVGTGSDVGAGRAATFVIPETVGSFVKSYDTTIKIMSSAQKELKRLQAQKGGSMKARNTMVKNIDTWSAQLVKDQKYDKTKLPIWGGKQIYVSLSALTQIKTAGGKFGAAGPSRMGAAIFGYITGQPLPGAKTLKDMGLARDAIITKDYIVAKEFGITREPVPVGAEVPARIDSPKLDRALQFFGFKPPPRPKVTQEMFENFLKVVNDESSVVGGVIIPGRAPSITTTTTTTQPFTGGSLPTLETITTKGSAEFTPDSDLMKWFKTAYYDVVAKPDSPPSGQYYPAIGLTDDQGNQLRGLSYQASGDMTAVKNPWKLHIVGYTPDDAANLYARTIALFEKYQIPHKYWFSKQVQSESRTFARDIIRTGFLVKQVDEVWDGMSAPIKSNYATGQATLDSIADTKSQLNKLKSETWDTVDQSLYGAKADYDMSKATRVTRLQKTLELQENFFEESTKPKTGLLGSTLERGAGKMLTVYLPKAMETDPNLMRAFTKELQTVMAGYEPTPAGRTGPLIGKVQIPEWTTPPMKNVLGGTEWGTVPMDKQLSGYIFYRYSKGGQSGSGHSYGKLGDPLDGADDYMAQFAWTPKGTTKTTEQIPSSFDFGLPPDVQKATSKANIPIGATLPKGYTQKPIVSTQKPIVTSEEYLKVQDPSYIIKTADDFKLPTSSEWGTGADFAKIRELEGMDYETGAVLGLERLGLVSGQDIATIQQPTFTVGDVMKGFLFGKKSEKKYFVGLVKESFGVGSQPINEYDKAMRLFSQATEKLKLVSKARQDPTEWLDVKPSRFDDTTPGMDEGVKIDTDWKPDISYPSDPNKPYRPQSFQPEDEPSKRMQSMYDAMEKRLQESTGITATTKSEEPSVRVQNIYAQMEEKLKNANIYTTEKGSRLPSGQFVSEYQISNYPTSVIEGVRLGDLPVSNVQQSLLETKLGVGKFVVEGGKLEELVLPPVRPDYKFTEKELVKIEKEAMKLFDEGKKALPSRSLYDTDLKSVPEDLFKNVRSLADDAVVLKNWLGGDFMPAFFRPPPPSRPKSVLRDASKGSFDTSSDDASQRLITMLKTEDVKITKEPLGPTLETVQQVAKADPLKPVMESVSDDILFSAPRNLASSLPYQRPFYPSYRSIFENVYNTQAPAEADILGVLQGGSASAMAPSIPLARPQVPQLGADPTIQLTMPQLQPVIEGISTTQLPSVATLSSSALRQPQKTLPLLDLTQRLNTGTDLTQVGRQRLQLDGLVLSRTRQILDIPLQEAVRVKPKPLPLGILPMWVDPYDKRRRPKKKKAKKRKKKKIWWDVPDSPFKTFSAKEYKVFTGGEPGRITRIERRRFPGENWGQY